MSMRREVLENNIINRYNKLLKKYRALHEAYTKCKETNNSLRAKAERIINQLEIEIDALKNEKGNLVERANKYIDELKNKIIELQKPLRTTINEDEWVQIDNKIKFRF